MTNLAKPYRAELADRFVIEVPEVVTRQISVDGTRKYLVRIAGGHEVETVYIPEENRGTLCVSSQVGCTLNCSFCYTGTQKLVRNLTAAEIVGQIMLARDDLGEWPEPGGGLAPAGFALFRAVAGEAEILTISVLPEARRSGIGAGLLAACEDGARASGAARLFLAVAEGTVAARCPYDRAGGRECGRGRMRARHRVLHQHRIQQGRKQQGDRRMASGRELLRQAAAPTRHRLAGADPIDAR